MKRLLLAASLALAPLASPAYAAPGSPPPPPALAQPAPASAATAGTPGAQSFFLSGEELWEPCNWPTDDPAAQSACVLYVVGVVDALNQNAATRVCLSLTITKIEVASVMKEWLRAHPDKRADPAARLVKTAMTEAYPCK